MVQRMSPLVRQIDFALEWMLVEAGKALYRYENKKFIFELYFHINFVNDIDKIISHKMFILFLMVVCAVFY